MPHIVVKLWPGHTEEEKKALAKVLAEDTARCLHGEVGWVSVAVDEVPEERWDKEVFQPEIAGRKDKLYVLPDELR